MGLRRRSRSPPRPSDPIGIFLEGWRSRVSADPEFPFKVLMEELIGVSANVLGDMASRPNFGLNELDLVFSTLVVGSIVNFVLMYLLAPTSSIASSAAISHMFEPGTTPSSPASASSPPRAPRSPPWVRGGARGTAISNTLVALRRRVGGAAASAAAADESPARSPPTVLNALTWAAHMGVSSNFRYQALNGIEYAAAKTLPPPGFKAAVVVLRCLNNVLGGCRSSRSRGSPDRRRPPRRSRWRRRTRRRMEQRSCRVRHRPSKWFLAFVAMNQF
uniref:Uncharacterized protein n=1 Tax=Ananas comosus var. bracteatus TaxID=296719 RepID=A0A6V7PE00_ANACO|nr:unnamed protein product [Ananas comosus var. bracteatus]